MTIDIINISYVYYKLLWLFMILFKISFIVAMDLKILKLAYIAMENSRSYLKILKVYM